MELHAQSRSLEDHKNKDKKPLKFRMRLYWGTVFVPYHRAQICGPESSKKLYLFTFWPFIFTALQFKPNFFKNICNFAPKRNAFFSPKQKKKKNPRNCFEKNYKLKFKILSNYKRTKNVLHHSHFLKFNV